MNTNTNAFSTIDTLDSVTGGTIPISPETVGCAVGGAATAEAGPWAAAAGCVVGGAVANTVSSKSFWQQLGDNTLGSIKRWGQSMLQH